MIRLFARYIVVIIEISKLRKCVYFERHWREKLWHKKRATNGWATNEKFCPMKCGRDDLLSFCVLFFSFWALFTTWDDYELPVKLTIIKPYAHWTIAKRCVIYIHLLSFVIIFVSTYFRVSVWQNDIQSKAAVLIVEFKLLEPNEKYEVRRVGWCFVPL